MEKGTYKVNLEILLDHSLAIDGCRKEILSIIIAELDESCWLNDHAVLPLSDVQGCTITRN